MLGELTRAYRRKLAISQEELADRTGLSSRAIRAIETGRSATPRPATVRLLADAFGLSGRERDDFCESALGPPPAPTEPARAPAAAPARDSRVPRGLPHAMPVFAGRGAYLDELTASLDDGRPGAVVISGTAGVGKSTLAVHWAHQIADRFPDGQLFVNLQGFGPARAVVGAGEAIRGFLQALEVPARQIPADLAGQVAAYRSALADRRVLLLVDNARDADHVRPLIPGNADCLLLVTSRRHLTSLVATDGAFAVHLDLPTPDEARMLLTGRLGARRVAAEPAAVDALIDRCARLPLALSVVAARAALRPRFSLAGIVEQLDGAGNQLDPLHGGDAVTDVRTVFSWSYEQLGADARLFRLLGLHPGPDIDGPAAAGLTGAPVDEARTALTTLADANLITEIRPGRYALHDLMRTYAGELADRIETPPERHRALLGMLDHYLHTGHAAAGLLAPHNEPITLAPAVAGTARVVPRDHRDAVEWFSTEIAPMVAVVRLAADTGFDAHAWQLAWSLDTFLHRQGRWHEAVDVYAVALRAAERLGSEIARAHCQQLLGRAMIHVDPDGARRHLNAAYTRFEALGVIGAAARTQQMLGVSYEHQNDPASALPHAHLALRLATSVGDDYLRGRFLNGLGWLHALLGDHAEAHTHCRQGLTLMIETGDDDGAADAWDSVGVALHHLGEPAEAVRCYQHALGLYRALGHRYYLALTLTHLGESHLAMGHTDPARQAWAEALEIFTALRRPEGDRVRRLLDEAIATDGIRR